MAKKHSGKRGRRAPKTVLRLPDLDQAKSVVLNTPAASSAFDLAVNDRIGIEPDAGSNRPVFRWPTIGRGS